MSKPMSLTDRLRHESLEHGAEIAELERQCNEIKNKIEELTAELEYRTVQRDTALRFASFEHKRVKELESSINAAYHKAAQQADAGSDHVLRFVRGCFNPVMGKV
jgi:TolA-binding protein